jgi:UrcA family protein
MKTIALIAAGLLASSGLAHAEEATTVVGPSPIVEHVSYQPSELATVHGIHGLRSRISQAAHRVCKSPESLMGPLNMRYCLDPVYREGIAQLDRAIARWRAGEQASANTISVRVR